MKVYSIKLGLNSCYLIKRKDTVMIDGGVPHKVGKFKRKLEDFCIRPNEIKLIILTHSHIDHAGSASDIQKLTGAKIAYINEQVIC